MLEIISYILLFIMGIYSICIGINEFRIDYELRKKSRTRKQRSDEQMNTIKIDNYYKPESKTLRLDETDLNQTDINAMQVLLKENQELKEKLDEYENPEDMTLFTIWCTEKVKDENKELKKQIEEWGHHLKCSKEMLEIQGQKGNYDYDEYMLGLYNGMEYVIALFETREPNYISGKDVEFTNNRAQQQEFILYLRHLSNWYSADGVKQGMVNDILQKYEEIIGGKHE